MFDQVDAHMDIRPIHKEADYRAILVHPDGIIDCVSRRQGHD